MTIEKKQLGTAPPEEPKEAESSAVAPVSTAPVVANAVPAVKPDLSKEAWDKSEKPKLWSDSAGGRLAIRTFSRGVLGAMFFTAGGLWARRMMFGERNPLTYKNQSDYSWENQYDASKGLFEQKNPLQFIAKTVDIVAGKPITATVNLFGGDGVRAVHFRPTQYGPGSGTHPEQWGRSLGFETVMVTFDFFMMSIGDAIGRDIAGWVDPGQRKIWAEQFTDKNHNVKWPDTVQALCKRAWQYVSYNGGEDWAVAIPYVYFMKMQRHGLDKLSTGFAKDFDAGMNGGSFKVRQHGADSHYNVVGSFNLEGMYDLQTRFTAYNMGTLLFREAYDKAAHMLRGENVNLYGAPDAPVDPKKGIAENVADTAKWMVRGIIKGAINMTPAVPFFWITRGMQSKHRGLFIDPKENAALSFRDKNGRAHYIYANDIDHATNTVRNEGYSNRTPVMFGAFDQEANNGHGKVKNGPMLPAEAGNPSARAGFNPYAWRHNVMENAFSWIGKKTRDFSQLLDPLANKFDMPAEQERNAGWITKQFKGVLGLRRDSERFTRFTRPMLNASIAYTPYIYMKGETARLWDNGKTDLALERTIDGASKLNWKEFRMGLGETFDAILHRPFADPAREAEAERRILIDTSVADAMTKEDAKASGQQQVNEITQFIDREKQAKSHSAKVQPAGDLSWQERAMQGKQSEESIGTQHSPQSHTDREGQRKFLEKASPLNTLAI